MVLAVGLAALLAGCSAAPGSGGRSQDPGSSSSLASSSSRGQIVTRAIPGGSTGFHARPALIYLPPAARRDPTHRLPVLELMSGTSGRPDDWRELGNVTAILDHFSATHGGDAPIVVMPDINGTVHADSECVRGPKGGNVERYLLDTVPDYGLAHFPASHNRRTWGLAGVSEGGTCAVVLGLRAYPGFRVIGDFSGLSRLTVGPTDDPESTIQDLFGGSRTAYEAHDPLRLLRARWFPEVSAWFRCGTDETLVHRDQATLAAASRRAGIEVDADTIAGGHSWRVWAISLTAMLPWYWARV